MLPRNADLLSFAKELRKNMTFEEKTLWYKFLSSYPIRFYRQKIIGNYIADFYCDKAKLVIEIDGAQHYTPEGRAYDEARTEFLEQYGLSVVRFSNSDIDDKFEGVCYIIEKTIKERLNS